MNLRVNIRLRVSLVANQDKNRSSSYSLKEWSIERVFDNLYQVVENDESKCELLDRRLNTVLNQLEVALTFDLYDFLL